MRIQYGYRYELNDDWKQHYSQDGHSGFDYAEPEKYADGAIIGDCWIVNSQGQVLPGMNVPYPHNISSLSNPIKIKPKKRLRI